MTPGRRPPADALSVQPARAADVGALEDLIRACGLDLVRQGFRNWLPPYPGMALQQDAANGELYVGAVRGDLIGTFALNRDDGGRYPSGMWHDPHADARYLHRLAIHPSQQGRGWGARLLRAAQGEAATLGAAWLRLDANAANAPLLAFYARAGYERRGEIDLALPRPDLPSLRLTCFERPVR